MRIYKVKERCKELTKSIPLRRCIFQAQTNVNIISFNANKITATMSEVVTYPLTRRVLEMEE